MGLKEAFLMARRSDNCFVILILTFSLSHTLSFAQEIPFIPRENVIFAALNQLQREVAIRDSMKEAQLRLLEGGFVEEETKKGGFSFRDLASRTHPYLTLQTRFDDNVDTSALTRKSSLINTITPGLKTNFIGKGKSLNLDIHTDNRYYNNRPRSNSQSATIDILSNFSMGRYILSISEGYFTNYISTPEFGVKTDEFTFYWKNTFNSTLGCNFNRIGFDTGYKRIDYDYEPNSGLDNDRIEETYNFNQYLHIATKTRLLLEYSHGRIKYTHEPPTSKDYTYNDFSLGLTGVPSSKLTGLLSTGYKEADYKEDDDYRDTTFTGNLGYNVSERTNFNFLLKYVIHEEATKQNYYIQKDFKLTGNHRLAFNPKFKLSLSYEADFYDYIKMADFSKENATHTWILGLSYAFRKWLDFSLNYTRKKTASNVDANYHQNIFLFKTQAKF